MSDSRPTLRCTSRRFGSNPFNLNLPAVSVAQIFLYLMLMDCKVLHACNDKFMEFCDMYEEHLAPPDPETLVKVDHFDVHNHTITKRAASYPRSFQPYRQERLLSSQISTILDTLFIHSGYDRQIRPGLGGPPLDVEMNIAIRSMGPVDEQSQVFSLDCYFRQFWTDDRLKYNNSARLKELSMNWQFLNKIWRPDTYILNGKNSYLHKMTIPNRFIRIAPNGRITYSQRLTVKARCQMDLHKFPLDTQVCPLEFGSFGHSSRDIKYRWSEKPLSMDKIELAQYHLVNWTLGSYQGYRSSSSKHNISTVSITFKFQRQQGFYLLQIYIPLTLIVMCSWVTFWLTKTEKGGEIPARTGLGASSVLSVVTIGFGGKTKPQVGYATALDVFIILCFLNVFAALVEFAFLNFLDTLVRRLKRKDTESRLVLLMAQHNVMHGRAPIIPKRQESTMDTDGIMTDEDLLTPPASSTPHHEEVVFNFNGRRNRRSSAQGRKASIYPASEAGEEEYDFMTRFLDNCLECLSYFNCCKPIRSMEIYARPHVVFNRVDACSRKMFPFTFLMFNLLYWYGYMYF